MLTFFRAAIFLGCVSSLVACTSPVSQTRVMSDADKPKAQQDRSTMLGGGAVASTNNLCIDNLNFIKDNDNEKYNSFSEEYALIGEGYHFLKINKNIMGNEAKNIYTMSLDMKLDALCSKVHFSAYKLVKRKINELPPN